MFNNDKIAAVETKVVTIVDEFAANRCKFDVMYEDYRVSKQDIYDKLTKLTKLTSDNNKLVDKVNELERQVWGLTNQSKYSIGDLVEYLSVIYTVVSVVVIDFQDSYNWGYRLVNNTNELLLGEGIPEGWLLKVIVTSKKKGKRKLLKG